MKLVRPLSLALAQAWQDQTTACCCRATWSCAKKPMAALSVGFIDPEAVMQMTSKAEVASVAQEVRRRLGRMRSALGGLAC